MVRLTADDLDTLRRGEVQSSLVVGGAILLLTLMLFVVVGLVGVTLNFAPLPYVLLVLAFVGGMVAASIIVLGWQRGHGIAVRHLKKVADWIDAEIEVKLAPLPLPPGSAEGETKPVEPVRPPITTGVAHPEAIGGIDVRDVAFLCRFIVRTNKWTAERLEGIELPHSHTIITNKDSRDGQGNPQPTTYARIMKLFEDRGIIVERAKGVTGRLTVNEPDEMLRQIRGIGAATKPDPT